MQQNEPVETERPLGFYVLALFMFFLASFIGFNFGKVPGAVVGFLFACLVNGYAFTIKFD
ncbi:MAG: hypothetical protein ACXVB9_21125 [Bdellovibrionota bacterium]